MLKTWTKLTLLFIFCSSFAVAANHSEPLIPNYPQTIPSTVTTFDILNSWYFHVGELPTKVTHPNAANTPTANWEKVKVPRILSKQPDKGVVGWYRVNFDTPNFDTLSKQPLALYMGGIRHGDETWLNGIKIGKTGKITGSWKFSHSNPQNSPRLYLIPEGVLKAKNNQLLIKVNIGFGKAIGAIYPGGTGISAGPVEIGDRETLKGKYQKSLMGIIAVDVVFIMLGLFDLFLIFILLRHTIDPFPEYPWLVISSLLMFLAVVAHDVFFYFNITGNHTNHLYIMSMLLLPTCNAMYFWSLYHNAPKRTLYSILGLQALLCALVLLPHIPSSIKAIAWTLGSIISAVLFIWILYVAIKRAWQKQIGARIQLFGILIYLLSIRTQWLPDGFFAHRNIQIGSVVFRFAILLAYIQQIHQLRQAYHQTVTKFLEAVENTRKHIARELHDGIGQHLASAKLFVNLTSKLANTNTWKNQHRIIHDELSDAIVGVRRTIIGLHTATLEKMTLMEAIHQEAIKLEALYAICIIVTVTKPSKKLGLTHETTSHTDELENFSILQKEHVFRLLQECLHNAIFHGEATDIEVNIAIKKYHIELSIGDNGKGFNSQQKTLKPEQRILSHDNKISGYGMINLKERVSLLHGRLAIKSHKGKGTRVSIIIPLTLNSVT